MKIPAARTIALVMSTSVLALGLTACSSDGDAEPTATETSAAADATTEAAEEPTEAPTTEDATEAPEAGGGAGDEFIAAMTKGIENLTTANITMEMSVAGAGAMSSTGQVDYTQDPPASSMTMTVSGMEMKSLTVGGKTYMNMGAASQNMWAEIDPATAGVDASSTDPLAALKLMGDAVTEATLVGSEDVDGVQADHWTVTLDMSAMGAAAAGATGLVTQDVWLDGEGRPVKTVAVIEVAGQSSSTTTTMSDFGTPVTIEAPPADQITTMPGVG